jgi:hypothetical protein
MHAKSMPVVFRAVCPFSVNTKKPLYSRGYSKINLAIQEISFAPFSSKRKPNIYQCDK